MSATPLQSFAAGAALCATSLGTTFSILGASGLTASRLGTVLTSAAMLDDVVGLVLVQVISNLGGSDSDFTTLTVVRPIVVSFGLVIFLLLVCRYIVAPGTRMYQRHQDKVDRLPVLKHANPNHVALAIHTATLVGFVAGVTYAGTSGLFAVYLAGASIRWWDDSFLDIPEGESGSGTQDNGSGLSSETSTDPRSPRDRDKDNVSSPEATANSAALESETAQQEPDERAAHEINIPGSHAPKPTGSFIYNKYYSTAVERILKPFFFVSLPSPFPFLSPSHLSINQINIYTGLNRLRNPHHKNVRRRHRLARDNLHNPNAPGKTPHRPMARQIRHQNPFSTDPPTKLFQMVMAKGEA